MTQLTETLYIGDWHEAKRCSDKGIITVAIDSEFIGHEHYKLVDGPGNDPNLFYEAIDAVVRSAKVRPTLVHCIAGRSRSAAVAVAAISDLLDIGVCSAYERLIKLHDRTRIHPALSRLLLSLE